MSTYVDIHVLSALGPNNMNRDENGAPKTIVFGGSTRHRLSSQSQKYATRGDFIDAYGDELVSLRSRSLPSLIALRLQEQDSSLTDLEARKLAARSLTLITYSKPADIKTKGLKVVEEAIKKQGDNYMPELSATFQISDTQSREFAKTVLDAIANGVDFTDIKVADDKELISALTETIRDRNTADVLLFGRMLASNQALSVDATCQVAHAIGVGTYAGDLDTFIAADEISTRDSELAQAIREHRGPDGGGADMLDEKGISAGTVYRYANVNVSALAKAVGSVADAADIVGKFITSFSTVLPGGAQNSHAARSPFSTLVVTVRNTAPMSLVGAFEIPVDNAREATEAMTNFAKETATMYGDTVGDKVFALTIHNRDGVVESLGADDPVKSLPALVSAVADAVQGF